MVGSEEGVVERDENNCKNALSRILEIRESSSRCHTVTVLPQIVRGKNDKIEVVLVVVQNVALPSFLFIRLCMWRWLISLIFPLNIIHFLRL